MVDTARERLAEIATYWDEIEQRAKKAEHFREEAIVAAINEMRYAGRRIVDVINQLEANGWDFNEQIREDLAVAYNYLTNADHDITDGICFFAHRRFRRVIEWHGSEKLSKSCPHYDVLYPEITKAQLVIQTSRRDRLKRKEDYAKLSKEYVPRVMELYERIRGNVDLRIPDDLPSRLSVLQKYVTIVGWIAVVGSFASILSVAIYFFDSPPNVTGSKQTEQSKEVNS